MAKLAKSKNAKPSPDEGLVHVGGFLVRATLGMLPYGGSATEILSLFIANPSEKRRDAFLNELAAQIDKMVAANYITLDQLTGDDEASAIFLQATQAAMRSEGRRKVLALRNAALNGATKRREKRTEAFIALGIIERLSDLHIVALQCFRMMPTVQPRRDVAFQTIVKAFPEFQEESRTGTAVLIMHDLVAMGLLREGFRLLAKEITDLSENPDENGEDTLELTMVGAVVLDYIKDPSR